MKIPWVLLALASCKNDEADEAQEKFDRAVERSGGIESDKAGRAYKAATGTYTDQRAVCREGARLSIRRRARHP